MNKEINIITFFISLSWFCPKTSRQTLNDWLTISLLFVIFILRHGLTTSPDVLVFLLLWRHTKTMATLKKKIFHWGKLLTVLEVQSIIIMTGIMAVYRQAWCWSSSWESYIVQATGSWLSTRWYPKWRKSQSLPHSDTLPPKMSYTLQQAMPPNSVTPYEIVGANCIQNTTPG